MSEDNYYKVKTKIYVASSTIKNIQNGSIIIIPLYDEVKK